MKKIDYKKELDKCASILCELMNMADEDTPHECRTRHFEDSMTDAHDYITRYKEITK